jgi:hypothetical protein
MEFFEVSFVGIGENKFTPFLAPTNHRPFFRDLAFLAITIEYNLIIVSNFEHKFE